MATGWLTFQETMFSLCCVFFQRGQILTRGPEALRFSPRLGQFLVGCFCAERPPLFLIFLSSLWDGRARLLLWLQNHRLPLDTKPPLHTRCTLLRGWWFRVCQSLLVPECVKKPELGRNCICKIHFYGLFQLVFKCQQRRGLPHESGRTITTKYVKVNLVFL